MNGSKFNELRCKDLLELQKALYHPTSYFC